MSRFLKRSQWLPRPRSEVFAFFQEPGNLARLTPPWLGFQVLTPQPLVMRTGARFDYEVRPLGFAQRWTTLIESYDPPHGFVDTQLKGPYASWRHRHSFTEEDGGTRVTDEIEYALPLEPLGLVALPEVRRRLDEIFAYREAAVAALFKPQGGSMKVVLAGGSGFIGRHLSRALVLAGHSVVLLTRGTKNSDLPGVTTRRWLAPGAEGWESVVDGADAVVNLCGEGVADRPWTAARRKALVDSRLGPTAALVAAIGRAKKKPSVLINASAVGYYPQNAGRVLAETDPAGSGFLADLCARWEKEARAAESHGARVVLLRIGVVLGPGGGALGRMLLPFKLGLGGRLGDGTQWFPWVHLEDVTGMVLAALGDERWRGPVNAVAPQAATNADFTAALGRALGRPTVLPVPGFALRLALGEMSDLLLGSQKIAPAAAAGRGYAFRKPTLDEALAGL
ncbi:MAG: TIGR01777 family oxidoreductase [Elusimicrobiota bacterium]|nr:TIGR01777 family oxidoreductase [Elusimicrobiota bacterium]